MNLIMEHKIDPEIVIFGSSVAEVGFNANLISEITDNFVYNAALDGTRIGQNKGLIDEFNTYSERCHTVILGLSFFSLSEESRMTEPSRFYAHFKNKNVERMFYESDTHNYIKLKYVPFYAFTQYTHTYYKNAGIGLKNFLKGKELAPDDHNGFIPHYNSWYGENIESNDFGSVAIDFSEKTLGQLTNVIRELNNKGRKVIMVICPMYMNGQKYYSNYQQLINKVKAFEKEGVKVYDFSSIPLNTDKNNFYNNGHLNVTGAKEFSRLIANSLKSSRETKELL
ncbi:hypothetical protein FNH22_26015 [Fulvivirga sp. M361]|nr:hypothetical protein FNH22_26015 [Fulvivirga sp. M361]